METTAGLLRHQPDEGSTSTPSSDTYLPCFHTRTHRNKPCLFEPTTRLPATFSQSWANRQARKTTHCYTDSRLPPPLSSARYSVAALALALISAKFGYFEDKVAQKSCVQQKPFLLCFQFTLSQNLKLSNGAQCFRQSALICVVTILVT